jgi:DUF1680 family protein
MINEKSMTNRREFLGTTGKAAAAAALAPLMQTALGAHQAMATDAGDGKTTPGLRVVLSPFDYQGVKLLHSPWQKQYASAREFYMSLSDDDVLKGFRAAAGMAAPGKTLGGWAARDSSGVIGQWLQSMARASRANDDKEMREKASLWVSEWGKTLGPDGNPRMRHYPYEKMVGGLLDMHHYAGHPDALALMDKISQYAVKNLNRGRTPANREPWELHSGRPLEWYTLGENLYRAYELTGNAMYKDFGDVWQYPAYWDKFLETAEPKNASGVHAYSHVNSFSSAAMAYDVTGDEKYLRAMKNMYDFLQNLQCYATGGYGPVERIMPADGALGDALEERVDCCEVPCCTWAGFKLAKYLMIYTGEARYGDWLERLLYNAIGAALPIVTGGKHFYYANYHLGAAMKTYSRNTFTCCSGTYFQNVSEYQNLIYFKDASGLYVNLYLPSEVEWKGPGGTVKLTQMTTYPEAENIMLELAMDQPMRFALKLRVPGWSRGMSISLNGGALSVPVKPGDWALIDRQWLPGDQVTVTIPLHFRRVAVDRQHPDRVALMRGPLVYAQEIVHKAMSVIPSSDDELDKLMIPTGIDPAVFTIANEPAVQQRDAFLPYYRFPEVTSYRMYFDPKLRRELW